MKYRDENGVFQDLYLPPTGDTLPIGTVVDYDGDTVPYGYEEYGTDDYSTEEVFTGKYWIDGKKIYRKAYSLQNQTVAQVSVGTITNLDTLINLNGILQGSSLINTIGSYSNDATSYSRLYMYGNAIYYQQGTVWQDTNYKINVVAEYTKTTN